MLLWALGLNRNTAQNNVFVVVPHMSLFRLWLSNRTREEKNMFYNNNEILRKTTH